MDIRNPGMAGLWNKFRMTAEPLGLLANMILQKSTDALLPSTREYLASYASKLNSCIYCEKMHQTISNQYRLQCSNESLIMIYKQIIEIVCKNEKDIDVDVELMKKAFEAGATCDDVHDVILIGAAFCMYSRYVRHTGSQRMHIDDTHYSQSAQDIVRNGYMIDNDESSCSFCETYPV